MRIGVVGQQIARAADGRNGAVLAEVRLANDERVKAYVKVLEPRAIVVEIVCAFVGQALGLPIPDPLLVAFVAESGATYGVGSLAKDSQNIGAFFSTQHEEVEALLAAWKKLPTSACFDELIDNCDRHEGNILFDGTSSIWLIDHDMALDLQRSADVRCIYNYFLEIARKAAATQLEQEALLKAVSQEIRRWKLLRFTGILQELPEAFRASAIPMLDYVHERVSHVAQLVFAQLDLAQKGMFDDAVTIH